MKIGEILRQLADAIDAEGIDGLNNLDPSPIMVSPLQQAHELLKKSTGVENDVDAFAADDPAAIARLQQMAGIQPAAAPVLNQTIVINTGQPGQEATVQTTPIEPVAETVETVAEIAKPKPAKKMSFKDDYANVSENDDCIIDLGDAYDKLQEEFEALNTNKGTR